MGLGDTQRCRGERCRDAFFAQVCASFCSETSTTSTTEAPTTAAVPTTGEESSRFEGGGGHFLLSIYRSLLYRSRFLRPNTHFLAFFENYKINTPLHRSKFKISIKNRPFFSRMNNELFNFQDFSIEFCHFEAKFS